MSNLFLQADAEHLPLADNSVDMTIGSPPYCRRRSYGVNAQRACRDWVAWMLRVTLEAARVTRGPVMWVAAGEGNYEPAVEGLIWEAKLAGLCVLRPCIWTKNAPPTGKGWFSNDWEFVAAFAKEMPLPYFNGEALQTPMKYKKGGAFRQRGVDGERKMGSAYPTHEFRKRPSNVFHVTVGGGHMGYDKADDNLACTNEAPFPVRLVEPFVKVLCPPGGIVLDPFSGSGTTARVCRELGRRFIAADLRANQVELGMLRNPGTVATGTPPPPERKEPQSFWLVGESVKG